MATLKQILGNRFKEGMTFEEIEALELKLADLSTGDYVSKSKHSAEIEKLNEKVAAAGNKQTDISKAVEEAKKALRTELETQYNNERTADKRKRAKGKALESLNDEQKGILEAMLKDDDLILSEDGEGFTNFDELMKPIKEKYKTVFPVDANGKNGKAGLGGGNGDKPNADEFADLRKIR